MDVWPKAETVSDMDVQLLPVPALQNAAFQQTFPLLCSAFFSLPQPKHRLHEELRQQACFPLGVLSPGQWSWLSGFLFHFYTWAFRTYMSTKSLLSPFWSDPVVISSLHSDLLISPFSIVPSHISYFFVFLWEKQDIYIHICIYVYMYILYICMYMYTHTHIFVEWAD